MQLFLIELPPAPLPENVHERLASLLPAAAQERIQRFRLPEDALRSLAGRLAPIWYLRKYGLMDRAINPTFGRKGRGKPVLTEPALDPPIDFNTSHDGPYVLLGVATGSEAEIGVDLMMLPDDAVEIQKGISEQLSTQEKHSLALPMTTYERSKRITTLWTFKECYTKAIGQGVGFGLDRVALTLAPDGSVEAVCVDGEDVRWNGWKWASGFGSLTASTHDSGTGYSRQDARELRRQQEEQGKDYGWTVFWRGEEGTDGSGRSSEDGNIKAVTWDEFLDEFRDTLEHA